MPHRHGHPHQISIHALHEESDLLVSDVAMINGTISIHALHEESDASNINDLQKAPENFNPRSP